MVRARRVAGPHRRGVEQAVRRGRAAYLKDHLTPEMRPTDWSASSEKAEGEKSRSQVEQPEQRSVMATVTVLPLSEGDIGQRQAMRRAKQERRTLGSNLLVADGVLVRVRAIVAGVVVEQSGRDSGDVVGVAVGDTAGTETGGVVGTYQDESKSATAKR